MVHTDPQTEYTIGSGGKEDIRIQGPVPTDYGNQVKQNTVQLGALFNHVQFCLSEKSSGPTDFSARFITCSRQPDKLANVLDNVP